MGAKPSKNKAEKEKNAERVSVTLRERDIILDYDNKRKLKIHDVDVFPQGLSSLKLWPADIVLARFALLNSELFAGKNLLQLNAGVGLGAIAVRKFGQSERVSACEMKSQSVVNIVRNCEANGIKKKALVAFNFDWQDYSKYTLEYDTIIAAEVLQGEIHCSLFCRVVSSFLKENGQMYYVCNRQQLVGEIEKCIKIEEFPLVIQIAPLVDPRYFDSPLLNKLEGEEEFRSLLESKFYLITFTKIIPLKNQSDNPFQKIETVSDPLPKIEQTVKEHNEEQNSKQIIILSEIKEKVEVKQENKLEKEEVIENRQIIHKEEENYVEEDNKCNKEVIQENQFNNLEEAELKKAEIIMEKEINKIETENKIENLENKDKNKIEIFEQKESNETIEKEEIIEIKEQLYLKEEIKKYEEKEEDQNNSKEHEHEHEKTEHQIVEIKEDKEEKNENIEKIKEEEKEQIITLVKELATEENNLETKEIIQEKFEQTEEEKEEEVEKIKKTLIEEEIPITEKIEENIEKHNAIEEFENNNQEAKIESIENKEEKEQNEEKDENNDKNYIYKINLETHVVNNEADLNNHEIEQDNNTIKTQKIEDNTNELHIEEIKTEKPNIKFEEQSIQEEKEDKGIEDEQKKENDEQKNCEEEEEKTIENKPKEKKKKNKRNK